MKKVAIIIPVYNEADNIPQLIDNLKNIEREEFYFIFINDGSQDNSLNLLQKINLKSEIVIHKKNLGLANAVKSGLRKAIEIGADYVVKVDADLQHDLNEIDSLLIELNEDIDFVYGDRFNGNLNYRMELIRKFGNKFFSYLTKKLTGYKITDSQPGFIAMKIELARKLKLLGNYNYTQQVLIEAFIVKANSDFERALGTALGGYYKRGGEVVGGISGSGSSGSAGSSGSSGSSGETFGTSGSAGSSGSSGTSGVDGTSGTDGTSGSSGSSGADGGTGADGTSGSSGSSGETFGTSGSAGSSVRTVQPTPSEIRRHC